MTKASDDLGAALSDPTDSMVALMRVGVSFHIPWWRRLLFRIPYKRTLRMQRYILKQLRKQP